MFILQKYFYYCKQYNQFYVNYLSCYFITTKNQKTTQSIIWNQTGEIFFFSGMIKNRPRQNLTHQLLLLP